MPRHSKNAGGMGSESLRYHERQALGFGTMTERLGKETVKDFDHCALSLSPALDPVVTPEGVLYDREHILRCLLHQKKEVARQTKAWEAQAAKDKSKAELEAEARRAEAIERFHRENQMGGASARPADGAVLPDVDPASDDAPVPDAAERLKAAQLDAPETKTMNAFWLPSKTPTADPNAARKPSTETTCPTTSKRLRMKDLVDVKWTRAPESESDRLSGHGTHKYMCPVTRKTLTNATQVLILRPSGDAVSEEAYKMVIARDGAHDGKKVTGAIRLQKGGSGYAASGTQVESKKAFALGAGSGLADSRGQHRGGASRFGLKFN
jgi:nitric oxide synthase-interacting protein